MVGWLKQTLVLMCVGAVLGFSIWCLLGKSMTSMQFGSLGGSLSCKTDVELGLDKFVSMQLYSAMAGASLVFIGATIVRVRRKSKAPSAPAVQGSGTL